MKVISIKLFNGPNFYTHEPAVVAEVDYKDLPETNTRYIPEFRELLAATFPEFEHHTCPGDEGGSFLKRLSGDMHVGHVIEHAALEMFDRLYPPAGRVTRCGRSRTRHDRVMVETREGEVLRYLLPRVVDIVDGLLHGRSPNLGDVLLPALEILTDLQLGPSARCIVEAAERRGIPWSRENDMSLVRLGFGRNLHYVQAATTDQSSDIAVDIVGNKNETKRHLKNFSIPTPAGFIVHTEEEAVEASQKMEGPVAIKPLNGNQGKGVSLDLSTDDDVRQAFQHAQQFSSRVLVEEMLTGKNYRVLVVGGKMAAASERQAFKVMGDGVRTLEELIEIENQNPLRGNGHEKPLTKLKVSPNISAGLLRSGWSLDSVPTAGLEVEIGSGMNLSTGGSAKDVTDEVDRSVQLMCERAARVVGLDVCGIDVIFDNIASPLPQEGGGVIEINAAPGLRMHIHPSEGKARDVGAAIIEMLYPNDAPSRIPIIAVTGTNGKTTVTRLIAHVLGNTGRTIGTTTTDGILLGGESIVFGDMTGPASARTVLGDKIVDIAVLETARGGLIRRGLGWDWADIGVVTNITEDHIGQDGIGSVKDLVEIKSLIVERVRKGGILVLNADDEEAANLVYRPHVADVERDIVFFTTRYSNPVVDKHIGQGGTAYLLRDGWICERRGASATRLFDTAGIPITVNGTADYQIQNVMAAVAVARAMAMSVESIADALGSFRGNENNRGRTNIYRVNGGIAVVDYGHNPKAIEAIGKMIAKWGMKSTGIISFPGDRTDEVIRSSSRQTATAFDRIIVKGDKNLRGRRQGEVAEMMLQTIAGMGGPQDTTFELDPYAAFDREISAIKAGEVVVFFYEKLEPTLRVLEKYHAVPTDDVSDWARTIVPAGEPV